MNAGSAMFVIGTVMSINMALIVVCFKIRNQCDRTKSIFRGLIIQFMLLYGAILWASITDFGM